MAPPLSQFDALMVLLLSQPLHHKGLSLSWRRWRSWSCFYVSWPGQTSSPVWDFSGQSSYSGGCLLPPSEQELDQPSLPQFAPLELIPSPKESEAPSSIAERWRFYKNNRWEVNCSLKSTWSRSLGRWWGAPVGLSWDSPWSGPSPHLTLRTTPVWGSRTDPNGFAFSCPATLAGLGLRRTVGTHRACWGEHVSGLVKIGHICWQITYKM